MRFLFSKKRTGRSASSQTSEACQIISDITDVTCFCGNTLESIIDGPLNSLVGIILSYELSLLNDKLLTVTQPD